MRRRKFLRDSAAAATGVFVSSIIPISVFGKNSVSHFRLAAQLVRDGKIGKPGTVRIGLHDAAMIKDLGHIYFESAAWGTKTELTDPLSAEAVAEYYTGDVSGDFIARVDYINGITFLTGSSYPAGIMFEGTDGWIIAKGDNTGSGLIEASDKSINVNDININEDHHISTGESCQRGKRISLLINSAIMAGRKLNWG